MKLMHRIQEAEPYTTGHLVGYVWRDIRDYDYLDRRVIGKWFEFVVNLGKLTLTGGWQWRKK